MAGPEMVTVTKSEYERLHDRERTLEARCGHLIVDANRREEHATKIAESCTEHGKEIIHLRHLSSWYWAAMGQQESARQAIVNAIGNTIMSLRGHTEPVPVTDLVAWLEKITKAQDRVMRRPAGYPTLADCLRAGGCDHDGLSPGLAAEVTEALGITGVGS